MSTTNTPATTNDAIARRLADIRAGRPYSWSVDVYGTGRFERTLSKDDDGTFALHEVRTDLGGGEFTSDMTVSEADAERYLATVG